MAQTKEKFEQELIEVYRTKDHEITMLNDELRLALHEQTERGKFSVISHDNKFMTKS